MSIIFEHDENGKNGKFVEKTDNINVIETKHGILTAYDVNDPELNDSKYNIYVYYTFQNNKLFFKLGKADRTIRARYNNTTGNNAGSHMILVWSYHPSHIKAADKPIHDELNKHVNNGLGFKKASNEELNTNEAYEIENLDGIENFIGIVEDFIKTPTIKNRKSSPLYKSIKILVEEIKSYIIDMNIKYFILDLCARWGKTRTVIELLESCSERILVLASYVNTVKTSYKKEIGQNISYENILFVDPDEYKDANTLKNKIISHLNKNEDNKVVYYVALTGDESTCFDRRVEALYNLPKKININLVIEECDFGSHCELQIKKLKKLIKSVSTKHVFATSGTNPEKILNLFPKGAEYIKIKRDYLLDVSNDPDRKPVKINWYILNNNDLSKITGKNVMENWEDMFTIKNGKFQGEAYLKSFFNWYFNSVIPRETCRETCNRILANHIPFDPKYSTIIYIPRGNDKHAKLKVLLEQVVNDRYLIKCIDGNVTNNQEAEKFAITAINDAKKQNKTVIFISSDMANRSLSVPEIKNEILMLDNPSFESTTQKISRGLTPTDNESTCNIIDFRLEYKKPALNTYISGLGQAAINGEINNGNLNENIIFERLLEVQRSEKIAFYEYEYNGGKPFRMLSTDELKIMMNSDSDFLKTKGINILQKENKNISVPKQWNDELNLSKSYFPNTNVKGDCTKNKKIRKQNLSNCSENNEEKSTEENELMLKQKHFDFLLSYANCFVSYHPDIKDNIIYNEIINYMNDERKKAYEDTFKIDMQTIHDIVIRCNEHGFSFDNCIR